jgi:hypothetical protein
MGRLVHTHIQTPTPANYGVQIGRETIALTPIEGHFTATPHTTVERRERKKKKSGHTNRIIERPVDMTHIHNTHVILHSSLIKTSSGPFEATSRNFSPVSIPKKHNTTTACSIHISQPLPHPSESCPACIVGVRRGNPD